MTKLSHIEKESLYCMDFSTNSKKSTLAKGGLMKLLLLFLVGFSSLVAQERALFQTDFPPSEFKARREKTFEAIGNNAVAIIQGAPAVDAFKVFRQTNEFYYLCGLETPQAYLYLDGRNKKSSLYLPHRDAGRERGEGKILSVEDAELIKSLTGIDNVYGIELLSRNQIGALVRPPAPSLYTPFSPSEGVAQSRDEHLGGIAAIAADPWDGRPSREGNFINLLRSRFPSFEIRDLSPILDDMRLVKSPKEIELIRRASELAGLGLVEAMRGTRPGVSEYELDAAARYIFLVNGARHEGYSSITAGGTNAWMGHYFHNSSVLKDGDLVLMDFAPDYRYYTSDVTRMWPVNGTFAPWQKELFGYVVKYRDVLLKHIRPGVTSDEVMDEAKKEMTQVWNNTKFSKEIYKKAAEGALTFRGHLSHPVGLTVHDVGNYRKAPLKAGQVFSIDPMIWVPEESLYVRLEDVVVVTESGVENFTDWLPASFDGIEKIMREEGIIQTRPATPRGKH